LLYGCLGRLVTFNRWIFPTVTPWQDFWAGEIDSPDALPTGRYVDFAPGKGLQYHGMIAMEEDWVYTQVRAAEPPLPSSVPTAHKFMFACVGGHGPVCALENALAVAVDVALTAAVLVCVCVWMVGPQKDGLEESSNYYAPRLSSNELVEYVKDVNKVGGVVRT